MMEFLLQRNFSVDSMNLNTAVQFYDILDILKSAKLLTEKSDEHQTESLDIALNRWKAKHSHHNPLWNANQMISHIKTLFTITVLNDQVPYLYRYIYWYWANKTEEHTANISMNITRTFLEKEQSNIEHGRWVSVGLRIVAKKI